MKGLSPFLVSSTPKAHAFATNTNADVKSNIEASTPQPSTVVSCLPSDSESFPAESLSFGLQCVLLEAGGESPPHLSADTRAFQGCI